MKIPKIGDVLCVKEDNGEGTYVSLFLTDKIELSWCKDSWETTDEQFLIFCFSSSHDYLDFFCSSWYFGHDGQVWYESWHED